MSKPFFPSAAIEPARALALAVILFAATACFEPKSVVCPRSGRLCSVACSADGETCITDLCGNGIQEAGEACDDGNLRSGDNCSFDCKSDETCGNSYTDEIKSEACDDGNHADGDGCSSDCRSKESCGNKILDPDEQCDDGNDNDQDDCIHCVLARCGDGVRNMTGFTQEACDPTVPESGPCNLDCTPARCGDGRVSASTGEECDTGTHEDTATCDVDCTVPRCGDGRVNQAAGEQCDDGNTDNTDACLNTCKSSYCGDGFRNTYGTPLKEEACDDGNNTPEDRCPYGSQSCDLYCNEDCTKVLHLEGDYCGDGRVNGTEVCDDHNTVNEDHCPRGERECTSCNANCSSSIQIRDAVCGNLNLESGEVCDDGNEEACGTCNERCTEYLDAAQAHGTITLIIGIRQQLRDGETFSISDGVHPRRTFELDMTGAATPGNARVDILSASDTEQVVAAIAQAIDSQPDNVLAVSATANGRTVEIINLHEGTRGNRTIKENIFDPGFTVNGMSGGQARDCAEGRGCASDADCQFELVCDANHLCVEPE